MLVSIRSGDEFEGKTSGYWYIDRAAVPFLIEYENGIKNVSVYDGGWFQWQKDPENPVQLGAPGSADYKEVKVKDLSTDKAKK